MVRLHDRKLAGHQHLDAKRVTRRESSGVKRRGRPYNHTLLNVENDKPFSVSNFERPLLVMLHLR